MHRSAWLTLLLLALVASSGFAHAERNADRGGDGGDGDGDGDGDDAASTLAPEPVDARLHMLATATRATIDTLLQHILEDDHADDDMSKTTFKQHFPYALALDEAIAQDREASMLNETVRGAETLPPLWRKLLTPTAVLLLPREARERLLYCTRHEIRKRRRKLSPLATIINEAPFTKNGARAMKRDTKAASTAANAYYQAHAADAAIAGADIDPADGLAPLRAMTPGRLNALLDKIKIADAKGESVELSFEAALRAQIAEHADVLESNRVGAIAGTYRLPAQWQLLVSPEAYSQFNVHVRRLVLERSRAEIDARLPHFLASVPLKDTAADENSGDDKDESEDEANSGHKKKAKKSNE